MRPRQLRTTRLTGHPASAGRLPTASLHTHALASIRGFACMTVEKACKAPLPPQCIVCCLPIAHTYILDLVLCVLPAMAPQLATPPLRACIGLHMPLAPCSGMVVLVCIAIHRLLPHRWCVGVSIAAGVAAAPVPGRRALVDGLPLSGLDRPSPFSLFAGEARPV